MGRDALRALAQAGRGGDPDRPSRRVLQGGAGGERIGQPTAEGVAGGGGVDRPDGHGGDVPGAAVLDHQGAVGAQGDHHGPGGEPAGQLGGLLDRRRHATGGELRQLDPVGDQHVHLAEQRGGQGPHRRRVEHHLPSGRPGGGGHRLQRDLQLEQGHRGRRQRRPGGGDVVGGEPGVRARADHDLVLAVLADGDEGGAGRDTVDDPDPRAVHPVRLQRRQQLAPGLVVADTADHGDPAAEPGRRHRLVRPLAAGVPEHVVARDGLPWTGQPRNPDHQVQVQAPHDRDRSLGRGHGAADGARSGRS